ncbi:prepilin-type N-terminal cleavage/methylation domain-containing protein [Chitinimonas arctica]|uniref:Prepilin-type N-terminal cleavage/methylation domain-containing protein n=1 Tax=Chitinimonas arctica TaxID=2594795 RepID=A0A516SE34_9NEIS|nr:prepilin-type N-terminal cleavage/methylation domain-containing protein [Chitinimonas arctica]QDQ26401.1 prepilin-type N-terminal cleavage/methylation domain-containing protein [Chitinimonas arctica]
MRTRNSRQKGFTLIEIAIVLVIIGLLLGGVLKGQELITGAKVKALASDLKNMMVYINAYQDRFRSIPGDDLTAATHLTGATNATTPGAAANRGNGLITGNWDPTVAAQTDESYLFWQHVRLANLATGNSTVGAADYPPVNALGGRMGITSTTPVTGQTGTFFACANNITGDMANRVDILVDGAAQGAQGSLRVRANTAAAAAAAVAAPVATTLYTICLST